MSGWGCDREICPMIFGVKILRLDFLFLLYQDKRKKFPYHHKKQ
jgi:hypothetical protein